MFAFTASAVTGSERTRAPPGLKMALRVAGGVLGVGGRDHGGGWLLRPADGLRDAVNRMGRREVGERPGSDRGL